MKKILKFVNAGLFLISLACVFMNMVEIAIWKLSGLNFLKIGFTGRVEDEWLQYVISFAQEYVNNIAILLIVILAVTVLGALLNCFLPGKAAHVISIFMAFADLVCVIFMYVGIVTNVDAINDVLVFLMMDSFTKVKHMTFILWMAIYAVILILSVIGVFLKDKRKAPVKGDIYTEQFYGTQNPLQQQTPAKPAKKEKPVRQQELVQPVNPVQPVKPVQVYQDFHGAILGKSAIYNGKALPLMEKTKVFWVEDSGNIVTSKYEETDALAAVYFVSEYQEYFVEVMEKTMVFLASGQPLGKGRTYFLPRGTKLYIKDVENTFELA